MLKSVLLAIWVLAQTTGAQAASPAALTVKVAGVRSAAGQVVVTLCRAGEAFPAGCSARRGNRAATGVTTLRFTALKPGDYAVALYHDEDGDGKLTFMKEGIGFSNNANIAFGAPKFDKSRFAVTGETAITVRLKYFS